MRDILSRAHRGAIEPFAGSRVMVGLDFDGTLAPIVADPDSAAMRSTTGRLLKAVARRYPCVVLSGRSRDDVLRRLEGAPVRAVVGNHGMERARPAAAAVRRADGWAARLEERLRDEQGVVVEHKGLSLAVHYRAARRRTRARARILAAADGLRGVRVVGGKHVVNVVPAGAPHKGMALERERRRLRCAAAVYVGDDDTDEDAFALARHGRLLAVRVGHRAASAARYYIRAQRDVDRLLRLLLDLRRRGDDGGGPRDDRRPGATRLDRGPAAPRRGPRVHAAPLGRRPRAAAAVEADGRDPRGDGPAAARPARPRPLPRPLGG